MSNKHMICPHCQSKGTVRTKRIKKKSGISGGKVMGGILTGGLSLLATGLSRKHRMTEAKCSNCGNRWYF
jgi:transcription elongation factor Elf1